MKKLALVLLAGSFLVFSSCTKTGPQGPQGPQGATGATGANGADGNANVLGSNPFSVSTWTFSSANNAYYASFTDADITASVADKGVVEAYLYYPSDGTWRALPDIVNGTQFYMRFSSGGFEIYYSMVDGTTPLMPGTFTFRVVVISPSNKQSHPNTNWKNFNEAIAAQKDANAAPASAN